MMLHHGFPECRITSGATLTLLGTHPSLLLCGRRVTNELMLHENCLWN